MILITEKVIHLLSLLTLFSQIVVFILLILFLIEKFSTKKYSFITKTFQFFKDNSLKMGFIVSLTAVSASLFFSELAGMPPCKLCWLQRIFIYPQLLLTGLAFYKKDEKIWDYSLSLTLIGVGIAIYHYATQMSETFKDLADQLVPCSVVGMTPACSSYFFLKFDYITIPMMSVTTLVILITLALISKRKA